MRTSAPSKLLLVDSDRSVVSAVRTVGLLVTWLLFLNKEFVVAWLLLIGNDRDLVMMGRATVTSS
jgi:hypothetical protein